MKNRLYAIAILSAAPLLVANQLPQDVPPSVELDRGPLLVDPDALLSVEFDGPCADTIQEVREERALPLLQRGTTDPKEPILYRALDYDVDGCDVLLVSDEDIRPLPQVDPNAPLLQRAQ